MNGIHIHAPDATPEVQAFLVSRGWVYHPKPNSNFDNSYYNKPTAEGCFNYTWEQAVAYEYYLFITLGGVSPDPKPEPENPF